MLHHVQNRPRVDIPGARAHHQAFQRRESHTGRNGASARRGGHRAAASELKADDATRGAQGLLALSYGLTQMTMRRAVETVAPDAEVSPPSRWNGVADRGFRQIGVIRRVENADDRHLYPKP